MPRATLKVVPDDEHKILPSVRESLAALKNDPAHKHSTDKAMRKLAEVYARQIDDATELALDARELVRQAIEGELEGVEIAKRTLNALVKFSEGRMVLSDLGPRLQSVLETLGASPKARAAMTGSRGGGKPDDAGPAKPESSLERRRREAEERQQRARAHGSSSVDPATS